MNGFDYFNLVLVTNVAGSGDVAQMYIKGSSTGWIQMKRNWGQNWQCDTILVGQRLSFIVVLSHGHVVTSYDVAPSNWRFGQTFEGNQVLVQCSINKKMIYVYEYDMAQPLSFFLHVCNVLPKLDFTKLLTISKLLDLVQLFHSSI